ncbi:hypothetical protein LXL04_010433 [Taraxacum kok-saghyz]
MGPVLDLKGRKDTTMEASTSKDHSTDMQTQPYKTTTSENNNKSLQACNNEDNIIDCTNDNEFAFDHPHCEDDTATSSSFDDTFSDLGILEHEGDNEVMSELHRDDSSLMPRKKRVTSDWRKFIRPIMWRCKWLELQIKKFQSQAMKYDKVLEKDYQKKLLKYKNFESEGLCAKSMPFIHDSQRDKPLKRKKRKHEEMDTKLYMSPHFHILSTTNGGVTIDEDQTNPTTSSDKNVVNEFRVSDELLSLDFRDDYLLEQLLWKIEVAQNRLGGMSTKIDTIITENSGRFPSIEEINFHEANKVSPGVIKEAKNISGPSEFASFASELMKFNTGDELVKLENQDVNEPTKEEPPKKRNADGILIYNRRAKKKRPQADTGVVKIHPMEKLEEEGSKKTDLPLVSENSSSQNEEPALKIRSVSKLTAPKNKKKRASRTRRKTASSLWTRRNTG